MEELWEEDLEEYLTTDHGKEIKILLNIFKKYKKGDDVSAEDLIFESKMVLDRTWELLNLGKWIDVAVERKQVFAIASYVQVNFI